MPISNSRLSYQDCYKVMDQALEDDIGARCQLPDHDAAVFFRMRMHQARQIDRKDNKVLYEPDHPLYGRSTYDRLTVRIKEFDDKVFVYAERVQDPKSLESLSEVEQLEFAKSPQLEAPPPPLMIEHIRRRI